MANDIHCELIEHLKELHLPAIRESYEEVPCWLNVMNAAV